MFLLINSNWVNLSLSVFGFILLGKIWPILYPLYTIQTNSSYSGIQHQNWRQLEKQNLKMLSNPSEVAKFCFPCTCTCKRYEVLKFQKVFKSYLIQRENTQGRNSLLIKHKTYLHQTTNSWNHFGPMSDWNPQVCCSYLCYQIDCSDKGNEILERCFCNTWSLFFYQCLQFVIHIKHPIRPVNL